MGLHASAYRSAQLADTLAITAGAGQDNQAQTGIIIDRATYGYPTNGAIKVHYKTVLGASAKLTLKSVTLQHGDAANLSDAATLQTWPDADVIVDSGSGSTNYGPRNYDLSSLGAAKRYIRLIYTPDLSAANTDTASLTPTVIFDPPTYVA